MRRLDDSPIDPEIAASLDAIDATLAGEPVDPKYAELAELALLIAADRPEPSPEFGRALDERVARRFAAMPAAETSPSRPRRRSWWLAPAWGSGLVAGVVAVVVVLSSLGGASSSSSSSSAGHAAAASAVRQNAPAAATPIPANRKLAAGAASPAALSPGAFSAPTSTPATAPAPPNNGRKIIQSSQLALNAPPDKLDAVAQEVFDVVGQQNGIVNHSSVTASNSPGAYAEFQLSIPSTNLPQTMAALSRLRYATVSSRTDNTQDVNNQYAGDTRAVDQDKAQRTSLLKQLANAVTQTQIDSLNAQIRDINAKLASDESTLATLNHQVSYSQVQLTINAANITPVPGHGGFTIGKAAHDAGRVLTVAAGVALITLAVLVPAGLVAAFGWWVVTAVKRRRREQALDLA